MEYEEVEVNSKRWFDLKLLLNEEFRDIDFLLGEYQVSNYGRVKSLKRNRILRNSLCFKQPSPHYRVHISSCIKKINKMFYIHRLVARMFIPNPNNYLIINHIDGNRYNNKASNLEWCTVEQNNQHAFKIGIIKIKKGKENHMYGKPSLKRKKVAQFNKNNEFIRNWESIQQAQKELNISNISSCCYNFRKTSGGYKWKFVEE